MAFWCFLIEACRRPNPVEICTIWRKMHGGHSTANWEVIYWHWDYLTHLQDRDSILVVFTYQQLLYKIKQSQPIKSFLVDITWCAFVLKSYCAIFAKWVYCIQTLADLTNLKMKASLFNHWKHTHNTKRKIHMLKNPLSAASLKHNWNFGRKGEFKHCFRKHTQDINTCTHP